MGTHDQQLERLNKLLERGAITAAEYDKALAEMGIKAAVKTKTAKAKKVAGVLGQVTLAVGLVADAAHIFYPQLSGPLIAVGKIIGLIGSWF